MTEPTRPTDRLVGKRYAVVEEWVFHVDLSPAAFRCWAALRLHAGGETAFPRRRVLADLMHCSIDTVDRALADLRAAGLLVVEKRYDEAGDQTANLYRLAAGPIRTGAPPGRTDAATPSPPTRPPPAAPARPQEQTRSNRQDEQTARADAAPARQAPLLVVVEEASPARPRRSMAEHFAEFYDAYPRHEKRRDAETAWKVAITRADPETILAGARRYAADPNRDPAFTAHPGAWLRADRWADEPLPPRDAAPALQRTNLDRHLLDQRARFARMLEPQPFTKGDQ